MAEKYIINGPGWHCAGRQTACRSRTCPGTRSYLFSRACCGPWSPECGTGCNRIAGAVAYRKGSPRASGITAPSPSLFADSWSSRLRCRSRAGWSSASSSGSSSFSIGTFFCPPPAESRTTGPGRHPPQNKFSHLHFNGSTHGALVDQGRVCFPGVLLNPEFLAISFYISKNMLVFMALEPTIFPVKLYWLVWRKYLLNLLNLARFGWMLALALRPHEVRTHKNKTEDR